MINNVGNRGAGGVGLGTGSVQRGGASAKADGPRDQTPAGATTAAAEMAAAGAPVDLDRIAAIKAAIAEGRYPVDPDRIAEKMIALDLPARFAE